jgi:16S rRNA (adenine1518-N6/adenine1519-N6)-dimethyltransferase
MSHVPRKRFGQHFLADRSILARIIDAIDPRPGESILEIGPGPGVLTQPLVERAGRIQAIEIDRDLAASLRNRFTPEQLALVQGDALSFDYAALPERTRVVGNLPYNISTPLLFRLAEAGDRFADLHFMLQKEVVDRMAADASSADYGRLSVMIQHRFQVEPLFDVPPGAFRPPPKVESSVVKLVPRGTDDVGDIDEAVLRRVVTAAFSHRRKTLANALSGVIDAVTLSRLQIDARLRPENLTLAQYRALAAALQDREEH